MGEISINHEGNEQKLQNQIDQITLAIERENESRPSNPPASLQRHSHGFDLSEVSEEKSSNFNGSN